MTGKNYVGSYKEHRRIAPDGHDGQDPTLPSNYKTLDDKERKMVSPPSEKWFNETTEQEDRFGRRVPDKTPYDSVNSNTRYVPNHHADSLANPGSSYRSDSGSRSRSRGSAGKPKFTVYDENEVDRNVRLDPKMPYYAEQERRMRNPQRMSSPKRFEDAPYAKKYDDYGDF